MRKIQKTKANAGETLVEVLVSMVLFLLMLGVLQGAVSYSNAAMKKNQQIRADQAAILRELQSGGNVVKDGRKSIGFQATDSGFTALGNLVFTVDTSLERQVVTYTDQQNRQQTMTFYRYGSVMPETNSEGGDTP